MAAPFLGSLALPFMEYRWPKVDEMSIPLVEREFPPETGKMVLAPTPARGFRGSSPKNPRIAGQRNGRGTHRGLRPLRSLALATPALRGFFLEGGLAALARSRLHPRYRE